MKSYTNNPKKSLGQHWLKDEIILHDIVGYANLKSNDSVLEIGPGLGFLTNVIAKIAKEVIAVEVDNDVVDHLKNNISFNNVVVVIEDIRQYNLNGLPMKYKLIANIPYYLTSIIIREFSECTNRPSRAVLLIQKEVAERINASPGHMSLLALSTQFYWHVSLGRTVEACCFDPPPKIDSQVLILEPRVSSCLFPDVEPKLFFRLLKAGFSQRRKTLLNSLSAGLGHSKDEIHQLLDVVSIDATSRPQILSLDDWHRIYIAYINKFMV